jgi:hypothetical protein
MGDSRAQVMRYVGFANSVEDIGTDGPVEVSVNRAEGSALEVPLGFAVAWYDGVGMLQTTCEKELSSSAKGP